MNLYVKKDKLSYEEYCLIFGKGMRSYDSYLLEWNRHKKIEYEKTSWFKEYATWTKTYMLYEELKKLELKEIMKRRILCSDLSIIDIKIRDLRQAIIDRLTKEESNLRTIIQKDGNVYLERVGNIYGKSYELPSILFIEEDEDIYKIVCEKNIILKISEYLRVSINVIIDKSIRTFISFPIHKIFNAEIEIQKDIDKLDEEDLIKLQNEITKRQRLLQALKKDNNLSLHKDILKWHIKSPYMIDPHSEEMIYLGYDIWFEWNTKSTKIKVCSNDKKLTNAGFKIVPHAGSNGNPCLGKLTDPIIDAMEEMDIDMLKHLLTNFYQHPTLGDYWGETYQYWKDELECKECGKTFDRDESQSAYCENGPYCDDCGETCKCDNCKEYFRQDEIVTQEIIGENGHLVDVDLCQNCNDDWIRCETCGEQFYSNYENLLRKTRIRICKCCHDEKYKNRHKDYCIKKTIKTTVNQRIKRTKPIERTW